jgi:hypothetical protein
MGDITAEDVLDGLRLRYYGGGWVVLPGVRDGTGTQANRRADAIAVSVWPSTGLELHGFEIKVSRSDWLREMKDPWKAEAIAKYCDKWWLALAEPGIVKPEELPKGWGVMALDKRQHMQVIIQAEKKEPAAVSRAFLASLVYAAQKPNEDKQEQIVHRVYNVPTVEDLKGLEKLKTEKDRARALLRSQRELKTCQTRLRSALRAVETAMYLDESEMLEIQRVKNPEAPEDPPID